MTCYKIILADKSFLVVDETFELCLFTSVDSKPYRVNIEKYLKKLNRPKWLKFLNKEYYFIDQPTENESILLGFVIEKFDNKDNLPINNRFKNAEDIEVGDLVEGENGEGRRVSALHTGVDQMYKINIDGIEYTVNSGHILHLINKEDNTEVLDIPVDIYLTLTDEFKARWAMEKIV